MFKKNDKVAVIQSWNDKGEMTISRAIVTAWGNSVIRLQDAVSGEMFKAAYDAKGVNLERAYSPHIVADATDAELEAYALVRGQAMIEWKTEHYDRCLAQGNSEAYNRSITKDKAELQATPTTHFRQK